MSIADNLAPLHGYEIRGLEKPDQEANNAFIHGLQSELDLAEINLYKAKLEGFLNTANNDWLDYWGSWLGLHRYSGESDDDYRQRMINHVMHKRNTITAIRQAVAKFLKTNISNIYIYEPYRDMMIYNSSRWNTYKFYPSTYYRYAVIDIEIDAPINQVVSEVINLFRPAGVYWVLTSLVNVLNEKAPIINFSGDSSNIIESTDIDYVGFNDRDYTHITPNINKNFTITDPFIYNDSLLNGGKVYYEYSRAISRVAWLGKSLDDVTPKNSDTYMDAFNYVTHLSDMDEGRLSDMDQSPVEFDISGKSSQPVNLWPNDNPALYSGFNASDGVKITSYIDNDGHQVLRAEHNDNLNNSYVGPYYSVGLAKGKHYVISASVRGSNVKTDNLQVGGRNLLIGTSEDELSGKAYEFHDYQISGGLQPGTTYTLSGWARVDQTAMDHKQRVFIDVYSEDWSWSSQLNISGSLTSQYNKITFTTPSGKSFNPTVSVYLSHPDGGTNDHNNDSVSGTGYISKLKLEEGNVATDWTPAPEDLPTGDNLIPKINNIDGSLGVDLTKDIPSTWTRVATALTPDTTNPNGAFAFYAENIDKTKPGWFELKDIMLTEIPDPKAFLANKAIPGYVDLPANLNRTTLMGAVDLFDYFEDDNKDLAEDKQEVVLNNVEPQPYKALVLRFKRDKTIANQAINLYLYDFTVNLWVNFGTYNLTNNKYQLAKIDLATIKPYLNQNGIIFMKLVPENKIGSIDVDYFGFNFGGTITDVKCVAPSQAGLGAETK